MCRKSLHGNVVHIEAIKTAFETLKSRRISAHVLLIPKMGREADLVVAIDASKVGIPGFLLQEDTFGSLRPCYYWARKLRGCETKYSAYDYETLADVEAMSPVWRVFLLGCKHF
jgi:hypothetical protein